MHSSVVEIVLIEDSMEDADLTIRTLRKHHLANHLLHLHDGEEALKYFFEVDAKMPKLVLLDLKMPKVDGLEVLRKLKENETTRVVPVVVFTSSKEERDIVETYKLGVNAYIVKPVDFDKFVKAIGDVGLFWLVLNQPPSV